MAEAGAFPPLVPASVKAQHTCSVCGTYVGETLDGDYHVHASTNPKDAPTTVSAAAKPVEEAAAVKLAAIAAAAGDAVP